MIATEILDELPQLTEADRRAIWQMLLELGEKDHDVAACNQAALEGALMPVRDSTLVDVVGADGNRPDCLALDIKGRSQVGGHVHRVDRAAIVRGEPVDLMGPQARIKGVLLEDRKDFSSRLLLVRRKLAPNFAKRIWRRGSDSSFVAGIRLVQGGIQIHYPARSDVGHTILELRRNPGIVAFHNELRHLRAFRRRQVLELLDNFLCAHDGEYPRKIGSGKMRIFERKCVRNSRRLGVPEWNRKPRLCKGVWVGCFPAMSTVQEIEAAISKPSRAELKEFHSWYEEFVEDRLELTDEVKAKLDEAHREFAAGNFTTRQPK